MVSAYQMPSDLLGPYRVTVHASQPSIAMDTKMSGRTVATTIQSHDLEAAKIAFGFEQAAITIRVAIRASHVVLKLLTLAITEEQDPGGETADGKQGEETEAEAERHHQHCRGHIRW